MQVGHRALFFPIDTPSSEVDAAITKYISYLRNESPARSPGRFNTTRPLSSTASTAADSLAAQAKLLKNRFLELRQKAGSSLTEIYGPLKTLRRELSQLATTVLSSRVRPAWPDFSWTWDPSLEMMAMLMGLVAGPAGRADLPAGLEFPPNEIDTIISKDDFFLKVGDFLLNLPAQRGSKQQDSKFRELAVQATFCNVILLTAAFGYRFELEGNFYVENHEPVALFMLPDAAENLNPGLLHSVGLKIKNWPVLCTHDNGKPRNKFEDCNECVEQNNKHPVTLTSQMMRYILRFIITNPPRKVVEVIVQTDPRAPNNIMDCIYWLSNVDKTQTEAERERTLSALVQPLDEGFSQELGYENLYVGQVWKNKQAES